MGVQGVSVFVSEGQLHPTGLLETGGPSSVGQAASTIAAISFRAASSATETVPY